MIGKVFSVLVSSSFVFAILYGKTDALSDAILQGASNAVELCLSMMGVLCLWSGVISVLDGTGVTKAIAKLIRPMLKYLYPDAYKTNCGINEIAANFAANLLGLGNAALPLGLCAMEKLSSISVNGRKSTDMFTFAVMNTVPFQAFPTTLIALRSAALSQDPYEIIFPIYICSVITVVFAAVLCRTCSFFYRKVSP